MAAYALRGPLIALPATVGAPQPELAMTLHRLSSSSLVRRTRVACALPACLAVGLSVGCGDATQRATDADAGAEAAPAAIEQSAAAGAAAFDASWEERACEIVTAETVAATFELPVAAIERSNPVASRCAYEWEGTERDLSVEVRVAEWSEDAAAAAEYFERATRSMSATEVASAMDRVRANAAEGGKLDTAGKQAAASGIAGAVGAGGLDFQPVEGVGDQARFEPASGELHVRTDNLYFVVAAYLGPGMPMPAELNGKSIINASKAWMQDTAQQRQDAAATLARAAVATL